VLQFVHGEAGERLMEMKMGGANEPDQDSE
jgi:hypothetical protein